MYKSVELQDMGIYLHKALSLPPHCQCLFKPTTKGACLISQSYGDSYIYVAWPFLSITTGFAV